MTSAVFTGAGVSGDDPAALPRGFGLRNDVLKMMHKAAHESLCPLVLVDQLGRITEASYKLEVVLGRLSGTIGRDALGCIFALRLRVPNEAHMLSALHLVRGGKHVTVNFDIGIELAHDLITSRADLPPEAPQEYHDALPAWRALAQPQPPALRTVTSHDEFAAWLRDGQPPALLKVHGGLDRDQKTLKDVVVVDIEELAQLTPERNAAVEWLGTADRLLITGYSGGDPDVYQPLLAAARPSSIWSCKELPADSTVRTEAEARGIKVVEGSPGGLAVTALRGLLGPPEPPPWPVVPLPGDAYTERFRQWEHAVRATHPANLIAQAWAWLLADLGDLDAAEAMLATLTKKTKEHRLVPGSRLRHAEILYNRARGDDRDRAGDIFRDIATTAVDPAIRLHCLLRLGDVARNRAVSHAHSVRIIFDLTEAYIRPLQVILATRNGRRQPEEAGDAYRALQQTSLRILEQLASTAPRAGWPAIGVLCGAAAALGRRAARLAHNGNRLALIRQHRALLRSLAALLRRRPGPDHLQVDMLALRSTYRNADDLPGAANCAVTLAVLACANRDLPAARALLAEALVDYTAGRPDARPLPSGEALINVISCLFDRAEAFST